MKTTRYFYLPITIGLFALLFNAPTNVQAQKKGSKPQKCTILDQVDEFTKERNVSSGPNTFYSENINLRKSTLKGFNYQANSGFKSTILNFDFLARWENGEKIVVLIKYVWQVQNYLCFAAQFDYNNSKLMFILSNDEVLALTPYATEPATLNSGFEIQRMAFKVADSTWTKLRDFPPKKMRVVCLGSMGDIISLDIVIEEKYLGQIPFTLKCIDDLNLPIKKED